MAGAQDLADLVGCLWDYVAADSLHKDDIHPVTGAATDQTCLRRGKRDERLVVFTAKGTAAS